MKKNCAIIKADASQRGRTCWVDASVVAVANSKTARESTHEKHHVSLPGIKRDSSIEAGVASDLMAHAGQEKYEEKLHESLNSLLGSDSCPLKPKDGHNALNFMKKLLTVLNIEHAIVQHTAAKNSVINNIETKSCDMITFDMQRYIEEDLPSKIWAHDITSGICAVQILAPRSGCAKIIGLPDSIVIGKFEKYELKLRSMLVSEHGHVITIGTCENTSEWYVYDNEFAGKGSPPRKFESFSFQATMDLMFNFPHTYFNPKIGAVPLNPLFLEGPQSATTFMFDISHVE